MNNNPQWLNDMLRTGDKIIEEGKARDQALAREARLNDKRSPMKQIVDGIQTLIALALGVVGLFIGGMNFGWIGALVLGAVFFFGTAIGFGLIEEWFGGKAEKRLWKNRPADRTRDDLLQFWESRFDAPLLKELVDEIDLNGAAWVMDDKANFILRMHTGERLYIGQSDDGSGVLVQKRGGKGFNLRDAWHIMLGRKSVGDDSCTVTGNKKAKAEMWAAARLLDIEVNGYQPDAYALEVHQRMKKEYKENRP